MQRGLKCPLHFYSEHRYLTSRNVKQTCINMYDAVKLPFRRTQRLEFILPLQYTMPQFIVLMSSVSTYRSYCEKLLRIHLKELLEYLQKNREKWKAIFSLFAGIFFYLYIPGVQYAMRCSNIIYK